MSLGPMPVLRPCSFNYDAVHKSGVSTDYIRQFLHPVIIGMLSQRAPVTGGSNRRPLVVVIEIVAQKFVAFIRVSIRYYLFVQIEQLVQILRAIGDEQTPKSGDIEQALVSGELPFLFAMTIQRDFRIG